MPSRFPHEVGAAPGTLFLLTSELATNTFIFPHEMGHTLGLWHTHHGSGVDGHSARAGRPTPCGDNNLIRDHKDRRGDFCADTNVELPSSAMARIKAYGHWHKGTWHDTDATCTKEVYPVQTADGKEQREDAEECTMAAKHWCAWLYGRSNNGRCTNLADVGFTGWNVGTRNGNGINLMGYWSKGDGKVGPRAACWHASRPAATPWYIRCAPLCHG